MKDVVLKKIPLPDDCVTFGFHHKNLLLRFFFNISFLFYALVYN